MTGRITMSPNIENIDKQIELYSLLVDQIQKYNSIIWQAPTALVIANLLVIENFISSPILLLVISIFNFGLIYAFNRMIIQQRAIINSTKTVEKLLRNKYPEFIPRFSKTKLHAPILLVIILYLLNLFLVIFSISLL